MVSPVRDDHGELGNLCWQREQEATPSTSVASATVTGSQRELEINCSFCLAFRGGVRWGLRWSLTSRQLAQSCLHCAVIRAQ